MVRGKTKGVRMRKCLDIIDISAIAETFEHYWNEEGKDQLDIIIKKECIYDTYSIEHLKRIMEICWLNGAYIQNEELKQAWIDGSNANYKALKNDLKHCAKHGCTYIHECSYCYTETQKPSCDGVVVGGSSKEKLDNSIESIQAERGSVYGKFEFQAECVGNIIGACVTASRQGGELMSMGSKEIGAVAYIAIKLARYAVSPQHADTLIDLESYCNLIKKMELGDEM